MKADLGSSIDAHAMSKKPNPPEQPDDDALLREALKGVSPLPDAGRVMHPPRRMAPLAGQTARDEAEVLRESLSEDMSVVAIHRAGEKHTLEPIPRVLARADQALQILGRYKMRLDAVSGSLSALEVEDLVTVRDVATVLQRAEMVRRIAEEIEGYVVELGAGDGSVLLRVAKRLAPVNGRIRAVLVDARPSVSTETIAVFRTLGWDVDVQPSDVFD